MVEQQRRMRRNLGIALRLARNQDLTVATLGRAIGVTERRAGQIIWVLRDLGLVQPIGRVGNKPRGMPGGKKLWGLTWKGRLRFRTEKKPL